MTSLTLKAMVRMVSISAGVASFRARAWAVLIMGSPRSSFL